MEYKYVLRKIFQPTSDSVVLELGDKLDVPVFDFKPGQYVMISYVNEKGHIERKHAFSLASSPTEQGRIMLGIKIGGKFTQGLLKLKSGDQILVNGPFGSFVFDEKKHQDLVFLAGGIGITPFYSAIKYATDKKLSNKLTLLYSNKTVDGTLFFREIRALEEQNENLRALFSVTDKNILPVLKGVVNRRLDAPMISEFAGGIEGKTFFICGPASFMKAMKSNLLNLGVDPSRIEMEGFSMISGAGLLAGTKNVAYAMGFSGALMLASFYLIAHPGQTALSANKSGFELASSLLNDAEAAEAPLTASSTAPTEQNPAVVAVASSSDQLGSSTEPSVLALASQAAQAEKISATNPATISAAPIAAKQVQANKSAAPAPVTHTSTVSGQTVATKPAASAPVTSKPQSAAPAPITAASVPASTVTAAPVHATQPNATVSTPAPTPTTAASAPATATAPSATVTPTPSTRPVATAPTPAPTTSASSPATATAPSTTATTPVAVSPSTPTGTNSTRTRSRDDD